jgi:hypothetical protein
MGSNNKKTILLSEALHQQLSRLAGERGQTLGELVQEICARPRGDTPGTPSLRRRDREKPGDPEESEHARSH